MSCAIISCTDEAPRVDLDMSIGRKEEADRGCGRNWKVGKPSRPCELRFLQLRLDSSPVRPQHHIVPMSLDESLATLSALSQKDKATGYVELLRSLISAQPPSPSDIGKLVNNVVTQDHVGLVVARQVLGELLKALEEEPLKSNMDLQRKVIEVSLESIQRSVSFQEQVSKGV